MIYKVTFLDYWHLSSGLSAGAKLDSTVVRDQKGLPFIPGKTIKGLLKEQSQNEEFLKYCFGDEGQNIGKCYFSDASIESNTAKSILDNSLTRQLFNEIASTKIDENGIAETGSLREIEVVIPISLYGKIENIPTEYKEEMISCLKKIKRMGLNRNRGLGRCTIEIIEGEK
jgi:CRISPR/Cas system CMR subunit Cmr4 (Cas7 group RAMP superfamily)